jgi:hypothetical protein
MTKNRNNNMLNASIRAFARPRAAFGRSAALTLIAAAVLSACGGGGGNPGAVPPASGAGNTGASPGTGTTVPTPAVAETKVTLVMVDGAGSNVTSLSGGQSATLKATVLTPAGKPAANAIVQFATATDGLLDFTPDTGSALTDANGVAVVTVKPASFTSAGAVAVSATSVVDGKTGSSGVNISIGAAPLTVGALEFVSPPAVLPAFSTVALKIPVSSGGRPASVATGLVLSSDCVGAGSATLVAGAISDGVQLATYTNNGCTLVTDTITAAIGNSIQRGTIKVGSANIGSIQFSGSSAAGSSIVLRGSGGEGRSESAQVNFRVVDQQGSALGGVVVDFSATTNTGGLKVSPDSATTDAAGNVSATVSSGTIPTPVRVIAKATRNGASITGLSDALTISTGLPIQKSMSMSVGHYNIEGDLYDGETTPVTIMMADQYGNPVSDNTALSIVTEGGAVGSAVRGGCTTVNGACSVDLRSQDFRPLDGRVTVLAYAQGIENFTDVDGNGQYSGTAEFDIPTQDMGDAFLDTNFDGKYDSAAGDLPFPYGHTGYNKDGNNTWGMNYIRRSVEVVFSGSTAFFTRQVCSGSTCRDWTATDGDPFVVLGAAGNNCSSQQLVLRITDRHNNPMPYGTTLSVAGAVKVTVPLVSPDNIASTNLLGGTLHVLTVKPDDSCAAGNFTLQVKTPKGNITPFTFIAN